MGGSGKGRRALRRLVVWSVLTGVLLVLAAAMLPGAIAARDRAAALASFGGAVTDCGEIVVRELAADPPPGRPPWRDVRRITDPERIAEIVRGIDVLPNKPFTRWASSSEVRQKLVFKTGSGTVELMVLEDESLSCRLWRSQYHMTAECRAMIASLTEPAGPPSSQPAGRY